MNKPLKSQTKIKSAEAENSHLFKRLQQIPNESSSTVEEFNYDTSPSKMRRGGRNPICQLFKLRNSVMFLLVGLIFNLYMWSETLQIPSLLDTEKDIMLFESDQEPAASTLSSAAYIGEQKASQREQKFIIILSSPAMNFRNTERSFLRWSQDYKIRPYSYALPNLSPENYTISEGFIPFVEALATKSLAIPRGHNLYNRTKSKLSEFFIEEFRQTFNSLWMQNKSVIVGLERFQGISAKIIDKVLDELVATFPWNDSRYSLKGANDSATIFVLYRSSHIGHIQSLWAASSTTKRFSDWLKSVESVSDLNNHFSIAQKLFDRGVNVGVIDIDYVVERNRNLNHYIACDVLDLECDSRGNLLLAHNTTMIPTVLPIRREGLDLVDQSKLQKMNNILQDDNCCYEFLKSDKVTFFPSTLREKFSTCTCNLNREETSKRIRNLVE